MPEVGNMKKFEYLMSWNYALRIWTPKERLLNELQNSQTAQEVP